MNDCEEFETCTCTVFQSYMVFLYPYRSPISVPFSYIHTYPLYRYCFFILRYTIVISTVIMTPACYHLTPV